jgi:hypothetical protein
VEADHSRLAPRLSRRAGLPERHAGRLPPSHGLAQPPGPISWRRNDTTVRAGGARVCGRGALTRAAPERRAEAKALVSRAGEPVSRVQTASLTQRVVTQAAPEA